MLTMMLHDGCLKTLHLKYHQLSDKTVKSLNSTIQMSRTPSPLNNWLNTRREAQTLGYGNSHHTQKVLPVHSRKLMSYLFIPLVDKHVQIFKNTIWNTHRIRKQPDALLPDGVQNHIYNFPEEYGLEECGMQSIG